MDITPRMLRNALICGEHEEKQVSLKTNEDGEVQLMLGEEILFVGAAQSAIAYMNNKFGFDDIWIPFGW